MTTNTSLPTAIIDGKSIAEDLFQQLKSFLGKLGDRVPGLAVILVGDDPASAVYVKSKIAKTQKLGMRSLSFHLPGNTSQEELFKLIEEVNQRPDIHGILLQLPLPGHLSEQEAILKIDPRKDVDGLHPLNAGLLVGSEPMAMPPVVPCTPLGCLLLAQQVMGRKSFEGVRAVVVGRSKLVGKPLFHLLTLFNATVTLAHSKTKNLKELCQQADILVAAIGKAEFIDASYVKKGALVIDVGINRQADGKLVGDVKLSAVRGIAHAVTPVPGGVGPMTIACLLYNTLRTFCQLENIPFDFQLQFSHSWRKDTLL